MTTYPGLEELHDRAWDELVSQVYAAMPDAKEKGHWTMAQPAWIAIHEGLTELYNTLGAVPNDCVTPFIPFRFHLVAAATAMTRDEFVAHATGEAENLRRRSSRRRCGCGAVDAGGRRDTWRDLFLASLEDGGLLRAEDDPPPIRNQEKIVSLMATLASGILIGPAGEEIAASGDLLGLLRPGARMVRPRPDPAGRHRVLGPAREATAMRTKSRCRRCPSSRTTISACHADALRGVPRLCAVDVVRGSWRRPAAGVPDQRPAAGRTARSSTLDLTQYLEGDAAGRAGIDHRPADRRHRRLAAGG